jgi:anti-sigma regulatory factor (Ser/Thr protein kinase)
VRDPTGTGPGTEPRDEALRRLARLSRLPTVQLRWPRASYAALLAYYVTGIAALHLGGLPGWRIAGVASCWLAQALATHVFLVRGTGPVELGAYPPGAVRLGVTHLVTTSLAAALTGGLSSPLLATLLIPAITSYALFGPARESRVLAAVTASCLVAVGAVPPAWSGPALAAAGDVLAATSAVATVAVVCINVMRLQRILHDAGRELARVREELGAHALARARAWLEVIGREAARMQGILAEYLSFSRPLQTFRPERVALGALVADVLEVLSGRAAKAGVREDGRGDASVTADPRRLREALLNLVSNAIDATPAGGRVEVDVGGDDGHARIVIRDTGRGMPPDVLARVGTPFFTTRETGTGLGVVLARSVFHRHGGGLRYESAPGRGTTVTATLPASPAGP